MSYAPIEKHGIIGDMETAALVSNDGAIDFMCFPHFDSPTIFASLLDAHKGGFFQIKPASGEYHRHQSYRPNTNILDTTFRSADATVIVSDFMTIEQSGGRRCLVRRVETIRGKVRFQAVCAPKFGYGKVGHKVEKRRRGILFVPNRATMPPMILHANVPLEHETGEARARFNLRAGQSAWFVLEEFSPFVAEADGHWVLDALEKTLRYWQSWVAQSTYRGRWQEMVQRSALTLALLRSKRDGSIVAAPTFGLPEWPGSDLNWDYRFTWVRDASFALDAFLKLGYTKEASAIMGWLEERCRQSIAEKPLQVVYHLNGLRKLPERELDSFEGYKASRPVRIGNAAFDQLQLDIYGEFIDSVFLYDNHKGISLEFWRNIRNLVEWVCQNWKRADHGIWEIRKAAPPYFYSRAMCWVAVDRAIKLAQRRSFPAPLDRWSSVQKRIYKSIGPSFWNSKVKSFTQYRGAKTMDASLLLLPRVKFIDSSDSRWRLTLKAIEKYLVEDCFVYQYRQTASSIKDGKVSEGTFSACSFWYVEALVEANDLVKAQAVFEKFLGYANELGLYAEQLGPQSEHLGNFPQALSHISLIRAACDLNERLSKPR